MTLDTGFAALLLVLLLGIAGLAQVRRWSVPLAVSVITALVLRIIVAVLAQGHTPHDVNRYFHTTALLVSHGKDPLRHMPRYQWNFLPVMPYVWSLLLHLHFPWEVTDKIPTIAADCVNCVLVAALAPTRKRLRAFQYAINPIALLVTSWHGQVEPIALAFALSGLVVLRRDRSLLAGTLVGTAIAIKTWPVVFVAGLLRGTRRARWLNVLAGVVVVPLIVLVTMPLLIDARLRKDIDIIAGYRSLVGFWGWSALVRIFWNGAAVGYSRPVVRTEQRLALVLMVIAFAAVIWVWRRAAPAVLVLALLFAMLSVTAGFGTQYLLWPVPLAIAYATWRTAPFVLAGSLFAAVTYLRPQDATANYLMFESLVVIATMILALPFERRIEPDDACRSGRRRQRPLATRSGGISPGGIVMVSDDSS